MEFDTNTPVNDEARRLAETKKITLEPLHNDITPEDPSDTEIATRHILDPAIANIPSDTEQNASLIQPAVQTQNTPSSITQSNNHSTTVIIGSIIVVCLLVAATYFLFVG